MNKKTSSYSRKQFLQSTGLGLLSLSVGSCILGEEKRSQASRARTHSNAPSYRWRMVTTWPPDFPILGEAATRYADEVYRMSNGRLQIEVFGGGELVPALQAFDAVRQNNAQIGCGAAYYWAGKSPAAPFFAAVPFGMNAQQMTAWLMQGGGYELWKELYADFGLLPIPGGNTGVQMGGWFRTPIQSADDIKGLKMRIPGLGGQVWEAMGGAAVLVAGGEVYTALERGVIDATEWIGPYHDYRMGFARIASHYYYPGWHEPGSQLEFFIHKDTYQSLPTDLQAICLAAGYRVQSLILAQFDTMNAAYLQRIQSENEVRILPFPEDVLSQLYQKTTTIIQDLIAADPFSRKVYESYYNFQKTITPWTEITEKAYLRLPFMSTR